MIKITAEGTLLFAFERTPSVYIVFFKATSQSIINAEGKNIVNNHEIVHAKLVHTRRISVL